jgi:transaldolase
MLKFDALKTKIFMDGADLASIRAMASDPIIRGFTTNPSLMRAAGVTDYVAFAREAIATAGQKPVSLEVFADDFAGMEREARLIASWGGNTYVKIPVTNTRGESTGALVSKLSGDGVRINVTAILTLPQVEAASKALSTNTPSIVSVFAGRIADTGVDPTLIMSDARRIVAGNPKIELLWASCRELLNVFQAEACGCHVITVPPGILGKLPLVGKDLTEYSLDTVRDFFKDARAAGYQISA